MLADRLSVSVLVGCECSGAIRDAFRRRGVEAFSCDLKAADPNGQFPQFHVVGDVLAIARSRKWRLFIVHPPCQFLSGSGLHWNKRDPTGERDRKTHEAGLFAKECFDVDADHVCAENPRGRLATYLGPASQVVQPMQFGDDASKETRLWLRHLPKLRPTGWRPGRIVDDGRAQLGLFGTGVERWENQTDCGQNRLGETRDRAAKRAVTYPGIAEAMADQWLQFAA